MLPSTGDVFAAPEPSAAAAAAAAAAAKPTQLDGRVSLSSALLRGLQERAPPLLPNLRTAEGLALRLPAATASSSNTSTTAAAATAAAAAASSASSALASEAAEAAEAQAAVGMRPPPARADRSAGALEGLGALLGGLRIQILSADADPAASVAAIDAAAAAAAGAAGGNAGEPAAALADDEAWNERFQQAWERPEPALEHAVEKALALRALGGRFAAVAAAVARTIVAEYALPDALKTVPPLLHQAGGADAAGPDAPGPAGHALFLLRGMLLHVAQRPSAADEAAATSAESSSADPAALLRLLEAVTPRKLAGAEVRAAASWQSALSRCRAALAQPAPATRLCTVPACTVDFGGFRVLAMAVPPVDDSDHDLGTLACGRLGADALGAFGDGGGAGGADGLAVAEGNGSLPWRPAPRALRNELLRAGACLNLKAHQLIALPPPPPIASGRQQQQQQQQQQQPRSHAIVTSVDTQCHHCHDGRFYLLNLARSAAPDLPLPRPLPPLEQLPPDFIGSRRAHQSALHAAATAAAAAAAGGGGTGAGSVEMLRPEAVEHFPTAVSTDAYRADLAPHAAATPTHAALLPEDAHQNDTDAAHASQWVSEELVPAFVRRLDQLELLPPDSASFTAAMHGAGVNARRLGAVAALTRLPHVRATAVAEMVARTCKLLLGARLRSIAARAKADCARAHSMMLVAGHGLGGGGGVVGAGRQHHFRDVLEQADVAAAAATVELVNRVVCADAARCERFWRRTLAPLLLRKFGHALTTPDLRTAHAPQLLHAIEHHCGMTLAWPAAAANAVGSATTGGSAGSTAPGALPPFVPDALLSLHAVVGAPQDAGLEAARLAANAEGYAERGEAALALQALKLRLSLLQAEETGAVGAAGEAAAAAAKAAEELVGGEGHWVGGPPTPAAAAAGAAAAAADARSPAALLEEARVLVDMASLAARTADVTAAAAGMGSSAAGAAPATADVAGAGRIVGALARVALSCASRATRLAPPRHAIGALAHAAAARAHLVLLDAAAAELVAQATAGQFGAGAGLANYLAAAVEQHAGPARAEARAALADAEAHLGEHHPLMCELRALLADSHRRAALALMAGADAGLTAAAGAPQGALGSLSHAYTLRAARELGRARHLARIALGSSAPAVAWYHRRLGHLHCLSARCGDAGSSSSSGNGGGSSLCKEDAFAASFFGGAAHVLPATTMALQRAQAEFDAALLVLSPALRQLESGGGLSGSGGGARGCALLLHEQHSLLRAGGGNRGSNPNVPGVLAVAECCVDKAEVLAQRGLLTEGHAFSHCAVSLLGAALVVLEGEARVEAHTGIAASGGSSAGAAWQTALSAFVQANWRAAQTAEQQAETDAAVGVSSGAWCSIMRECECENACFVCCCCSLAPTSDLSAAPHSSCPLATYVRSTTRPSCPYCVGASERGHLRGAGHRRQSPRRARLM
jgi:trimeric autotransporter adhesin